MRRSYVCLDCRLKWQPSLRLRRAFATTSTRSSSNPAVSRPSTAPKPTPNFKDIRANAEVYSQNCIDRNYNGLADYPFKIRSLAEEAASLQNSLKEPRSKIKILEKVIARRATLGAWKPVEDDGDKLREEAKQLKDEADRLVVRREQCLEEMERLSLSLPNLTSPETPIGNEPRTVQYINYDPKNPPSYVQSPSLARSHVSIGKDLDVLDFSSSATTTGWGWYYLVNEGALLEHALVQYALSVALRRGWRPVSPPTLVYSHIAEACGFQPRDSNNEQQTWAIEQSQKDESKPKRCLTGTAEIPLAAMHAGNVIPREELPIKLVGASRCYRAEAGARGVDTKGLYRVHEFTKVELFGWAEENALPSASSQTATTTTPSEQPSPSTSTSLFDEMLSIQTEILTSLELPCRVLEMPSGDLGASATRKRDIEALFPSRLRRNVSSSSDSPDGALERRSPPTEQGWGEVTSASICTDYQSRRLDTRVRSGTGGTSRFPETVNGTALAVPRIIAAILENGWDDKLGGVVVPGVLRAFMGGMDVIRARSRG